MEDLKKNPVFENIGPEIICDDFEFEPSDDDLNIKNQITRIFKNCPEDEIFRKVLLLILETMNSRYGVFGYIDENGDLVCPIVTCDILDRLGLSERNIIFPRERWDVFWNYAVKEKRAFFSNDSLLPPKRNIPVNNALTVPIIYQDDVIGIISIGDKSADYNDKDIKLLENIAHHIAPSLFSGLKNENTNPNREIIKENQGFSNISESDYAKDYKHVFEKIANPIVIINRNGLIVECNNCVKDILGFSRDELIGQVILNIIHPKYRGMVNESLKRIWDNGNSYDIEYKLIRKDGQSIDVSVSSSELTDWNGGSGHNIWMIFDITARKKIERKIIEERNRAEVYLDIMARDIKNLNQAISSYSELLLLKPNLSEQFRKYIQTTLDQSRSISDLISNIRKLSELEKDDIELENIDAFKELVAACERVRRRYPEKSIRISQSMTESEVIVKNNGSLFNVFFNIMSNAIKFDKHTEIFIDISHSLTPDQDYWKIEFKDNGPGVNDNFKAKIFNQFEKGNHNLNGSGLGLAVANEIVTRSGGKIWVEDRDNGDPNGGSNFVVLLPVGDNT